MKNILSILLLLSSLTVFSQEDKEKKADDFFQIYYFDKAIDKYSRIDSLSLEGQRKLAESYYNRFEFVEAEKAYAKFIDSSAATLDDYFKYVLILKANGKYDEANKWMQEIKTKKEDDLRVKSFLETKPVFDSLLVENSKYKITNLAMNTEDEDFGTSYFKDQIVFASTRSGSKPILRKYNWNREPFLDMFVADKDTANELIKLKYLNKKYNQKWHEGPASFNKKGTFMAYTRNNYGEIAADGVVRLQIYFSEYAKGEWSDPEPFYLNSKDYSVGHPALTRNGRIMFFVSDMPGGYGGTDIYMVSKISKTKWGKPVNLGPKINTEGNEMFPFFQDKNSLLFFSSNGLDGLGGLDVYVAHATPTGFVDVKNLGVPINSKSDDFAYIIDDKLKTGYFSSNRPGGKGGDDIYKFAYTGDYKRKVVVDTTHVIIKDTVVNYIYDLLVLNETSNKPISNADVKIGKIIDITDSLGKVSAEFNIADTFKVVVNAVGYKEKEKFVSLEKSLSDKVVNDTIKLEVNMDEHIVLKNIYYDFDKSNILPESKVELNKLVKFMEDNPNLHVELSSHTDSRGSDSYNIKLSQRRAESAVRYVVSMGISKYRITAKGYGERRLVNRCSDGVPCTEAEHRQNRRTEIYIQGFGKALDIQQTKGKYSK